MIDFIKNLYRLYYDKNLTLAQYLLALRTHHVGALFSGLGGAITVATYVGAVIAQITMITSLVGVSITPIGWLVIGSGFCAAVVGFAIYSYHRFLWQCQKLEKDHHRHVIFESIKESLVKQIADKTEELKILKASLLARGIISQQEYEAEVDLQVQHNKLINAMFPPKEPKLKILKIFKKMYSKYDELITNLNPLYLKILEFVAVYGITLAAINGVLTGAALFLGISVGHLGVIAGFATISAALGVSLSGPIGIGIIFGIALVITSVLLIKKFFFDEPFQALTDKVQEQAENRPSVAEYRSLEAIESKIAELKLREKAHRQKICSRWKIAVYKTLAASRKERAHSKLSPSGELCDRDSGCEQVGKSEALPMPMERIVPNP